LELKMKQLRKKLNQNISTKNLPRNEEKNSTQAKEIKSKTREWEKFEKSPKRKSDLNQADKRIFCSDEEKSEFNSQDKEGNPPHSNVIFNTDSSGESQEKNDNKNKKFTYEILNGILNEISKSNELKGLFFF